MEQPPAVRATSGEADAGRPLSGSVERAQTLRKDYKKIGADFT